MAVARKLTVAVWHILMDHWSHALEVTETLVTKLGKLATEIGLPVLKELGYPSKVEFRERKLYQLQTVP